MIEGVGVWVLRLRTPGAPEALLLRRTTDPYRGEWFTVDGALEPGESPRVGALRELAEETSLVPRLLLRDDATPAWIDTVRGPVWLHGFVAFVTPDAGVALNAEHSDGRWFTGADALRSVPLASQRAALRRAIHRMGAWRTNDLLEATGAEHIPHPGGTLRGHLEGTAALLADFGARPALCAAGMLHAAYGTEGFERALLPLTERPLLQALVGNEVEALVYLYAACDRTHFHASLRAGRPAYRDRFDGTQRAKTPGEMRDLVELTFANELDLARGDASFRREQEAALVPLFRRCRRWVSARAYACFLQTFGLDGRGGTSRSR